MSSLENLPIEEKLDYIKKGRYLMDLIEDPHWLVRYEIAKQGFGLDILIEDPDPNVRIAVADQGYGLDILVQDKEWTVRQAVAKQGQEEYLEILVSDPVSDVRYEVVKQGYGLDVLMNDGDVTVARFARKKYIEFYGHLPIDVGIEKEESAEQAEQNKSDEVIVENEGTINEGDLIVEEPADEVQDASFKEETLEQDILSEDHPAESMNEKETMHDVSSEAIEAEGNGDRAVESVENERASHLDRDHGLIEIPELPITLDEAEIEMFLNDFEMKFPNVFSDFGYNGAKVLLVELAKVSYKNQLLNDSMTTLSHNMDDLLEQQVRTIKMYTTMLRQMEAERQKDRVSLEDESAALKKDHDSFVGDFKALCKKLDAEQEELSNSFKQSLKELKELCTDLKAGESHEMDMAVLEKSMGSVFKDVIQASNIKAEAPSIDFTPLKADLEKYVNHAVTCAVNDLDLPKEGPSLFTGRLRVVYCNVKEVLFWLSILASSVTCFTMIYWLFLR